MYNQKYRTTSLLESFNASLSTITPAKFNFFKILSRLETYIKDASNRLSKALQDPGPSKRKSKKRHYDFENIEFCTEQYKNGIFNVAQFLEYVVQDNRKILPALEINNYTYDDNEDSDDAEQATMESFFCYICRSEISNILFIPCRQVVVCAKCYPDQMPNQNECPKCKIRIDKIIEIAK